MRTPSAQSLRLVAAVLGAALGLFACTDDTSDHAQPVPIEVFEPGDATTAAARFDQLVHGLADHHIERSAAGAALLATRFGPGNGLGPDFNADSCTACHVGNARQAGELGNGYIGIGPVIHVSEPGAVDGTAPLPLPRYGTRLQLYSLEGEAEAQVNVLWETEAGTYPDGTTYELRRPVVSVVGRHGMLPANAQLSMRIPSQLAGPGLLDLVPEADIIAAADPDDADGNGISGRVQWVLDGDDARLGRHGWKAESFDLLHQAAGAFAHDIGVGTSTHPVSDQVELSNDELDDLAFHLRTLAVPRSRNDDDPAVRAGAELFQTVGCSGCHTPSQRTRATMAELDGLTLFAFTDLLLHDLGSGLDDGRPTLQASGAEWRTAPLWGIGALGDVNGHLSLLHDGRARTVEEAILWHGGEAEATTAAFMALSADQRGQLIDFVRSR